MITREEYIKAVEYIDCYIQSGLHNGGTFNKDVYSEYIRNINTRNRYKLQIKWWQFRKFIDMRYIPRLKTGDVLYKLRIHIFNILLLSIFEVFVSLILFFTTIQIPTLFIIFLSIILYSMYLMRKHDRLYNLYQQEHDKYLIKCRDKRLYTQYTREQKLKRICYGK